MSFIIIIFSPQRETKRSHSRSGKPSGTTVWLSHVLRYRLWVQCAGDEALLRHSRLQWLRHQDQKKHVGHAGRGSMILCDTGWYSPVNPEWLEYWDAGTTTSSAYFILKLQPTKGEWDLFLKIKPYQRHCLSVILLIVHLFVFTICFFFYFFVKRRHPYFSFCSNALTAAKV